MKGVSELYNTKKCVKSSGTFLDTYMHIGLDMNDPEDLDEVSEFRVVDKDGLMYENITNELNFNLNITYKTVQLLLNSRLKHESIKASFSVVLCRHFKLCANGLGDTSTN